MVDQLNSMSISHSAGSSHAQSSALRDLTRGTTKPDSAPMTAGSCIQYIVGSIAGAMWKIVPEGGAVREEDAGLQ